MTDSMHSSGPSSGQLSGLKVADIMSGNVICINQDDTTSFVVKIFDRCRISGAPVVDSAGEYVGVISKTDLFAKHLMDYIRLGGNLDELPVSEIMNPNQPITVTEEMSVERAADLMLVNKIHRVFVKNRIGKISGVVSSYDILKVVALESAAGHRPILTHPEAPDPKTARIEYLKDQFRKESSKQRS